LVGLKAERARRALVGDAALSVDQINTIGPAGIVSFCRVAELIEDGGKLDTEFSHTSAGNERSVFLTFRAGKNNFVFDIALHLPDVAGMRFRNVNDQECDAIAELLVELIEGGSLPPEWRSGIASEHKDDRLTLG
jgi:hypothetical protein